MGQSNVNIFKQRKTTQAPVSKPMTTKQEKIEKIRSQFEPDIDRMVQKMDVIRALKSPFNNRTMLKSEHFSSTD
jgi:hypothetical protein